MPFLKTSKKTEPLWKDWDEKAQKNGMRHTVFYVNGDTYRGEWLDNKRHGRGTYTWKETGCMYEGMWKNGKRDGFGTLSFTVGKAPYKREYSGEWKDGLRHGYGTEFYSDEEFYEGEWYAGKRNGWGRMYFRDGSTYEGLWLSDQQGGQGMVRSANENRYEGEWRDGKKNGPGKYYYLNTGQLLEGIWMNDIPSCGNIHDFSRDIAPQPTQYPIPPVKLVNPDKVLAEAEARCLQHLGW